MQPSRSHGEDALKTTNPQCTYCGDDLKVVDQQKRSETLRCLTCGRYFLHRHSGNTLIRLDQFHRRRGNRAGRRPYDDLAMAERLVLALVTDCWPSPATVVDFGIDSGSHLGALQYAARNGVTAYDLDRVIGDGRAITQLVRSVPEQPYSYVEFHTVWDTPADRDENEVVG